MNQLKEYNNDPRLQGRFIYTIWNTEVAKKVIQGSKASLQTSIPPYEAAGMKDKKDMICYNIVVSSYTGGPIQQLTNVLHHGIKGNGYIFESFSQLRLQEVLEDLSARFYAFIYTRQTRSLDEIRQYPNKKWVDLVIRYMQEEPAGVLKIMHNAGRMLPFVDSRTAWLKFAIMYARELGIKLDYSNYHETIINILNKFEKDLRQDLMAAENSANNPALPPQSSSGLSAIVSSLRRGRIDFATSPWLAWAKSPRGG